jgi:hypothetical protein
MHKPAGGIGSRNVVSKPVIGGPGARAVNHRWPASVGGARGNRAQAGLEGGGGVVLKGEAIRPSPYRGPSFNPVPQGNLVASSTVCGPGGSRMVYKSGGQHGLANPGPRSSERPVLGESPRKIFR